MPLSSLVFAGYALHRPQDPTPMTPRAPSDSAVDVQEESIERIQSGATCQRNSAFRHFFWRKNQKVFFITTLRARRERERNSISFPFCRREWSEKSKEKADCSYCSKSREASSGRRSFFFSSLHREAANWLDSCRNGEDLDLTIYSNRSTRNGYQWATRSTCSLPIRQSSIIVLGASDLNDSFICH